MQVAVGLAATFLGTSDVNDMLETESIVSVAFYDLDNLGDLVTRKNTGLIREGVQGKDRLLE